MPMEDILEKTDKPEKYTDKFEIKSNDVEFYRGALRLKYAIKPIPDAEKMQEYKYKKSVLENIDNAWKVIRRVVFSIENPRENEPHFFCLITADIKNGFQIKQVFYYMDMKKVSYGLMSLEEYSHREIRDNETGHNITGDKEGAHIDYHDISMEEFLAAQIQQRIKLKFQKPEVEKNADIDKEITKIIAYTIRNYWLKDFNLAELDNLETKGKTILNKAAVWAEPSD